MSTENPQSLLEFPCSFPVKAMGRQSDEFQQIVTNIILAHARIFEDEEIKSAPSKAENFVSVTVVIKAESQVQLDAIYQDLTDCELVLMAL